MRFLGTFVILMWERSGLKIFRRCVFLHQLILHQQKIIELGDKSDDDHLTLDEFLRYCMDHEKKLWLVFKSIDTNNSGILSLLYMLCYVFLTYCHMVKASCEHISRQDFSRILSNLSEL